MFRRILMLAAAASLFLHAGDSPRDRATLKGVKAVSVIIDVLPPDLLKEGVTDAAIRTRLTQRLRDAAIPLDDAAREFVGVRIASVRDSRGPFAVSIALGLYQPVTLVRDPSVRFAPVTWDSGLVVMATPKVLQRAALESIDELADRFIAAWRSVQ